MRSAVTMFVLLLFAAAAAGQETGSIEGTIHDALLARLPAAVYVKKSGNMTFSPPKASPVVDQKNLVFVPHVLPVLAGTTVTFRNSDTVKHNIFSSRRSPTVFNLGTYSAGVTKTVAFDKPGVVTLLCNVHSEMSAFVVVTETPWFAVTDREGKFRIDGVPPGSYQLEVWHEVLAAQPQSAAVRAGATTHVEWRQLKRK